ncbi:MAG: fatty acid desaturase, partial [Deltaproteobacteria bacterium]|nr:fatty acid desaturase [Deltaproteobacteria bacterium]
AKLVGSHIGSFPTMTLAWWKSASPWQRWQYAFTRHPITVVNAYFTAFFLEMCVLSFKRSPRKRWDSLLAAFVVVGLAVAVSLKVGFGVWFWAVFLPHYFACAVGAYLFYAQHNYPELEIQPRETWSYDRAALHSSSYMELGPVLAWFTANIGYHHVHHLNPGIPFYRLPEAMAALPELQSPGKTTLSPSSIAACFRLKLWDAEAGRMVGYPAA